MSGTIPIELRRDGGRIAYGEMAQPIPVPETFDRAPRVAGSARGRALPIADRGLPEWTTSCLRRSLQRCRGRCSAPGHDGARGNQHSPAASAASPLEALISRQGCSRPHSESTRIPRPARRPARWRCTSPATGGSRSANGSRSAREPRFRGHRCSTRKSTEARRGSRG